MDEKQLAISERAMPITFISFANCILWGVKTSGKSRLGETNRRGNITLPPLPLGYLLNESPGVLSTLLQRIRKVHPTSS